MSYTYEKLENNKVKVEITISKENWQKHIQDSYEKNRGKFSIQGFRKGKAPKKVIEQQYGEGVFFDDAIDSAFSEEYYEFLQAESQIQPILNPQIQIDKFDENGVVITAEIDVVPEVVLGKYEGLTIEKNKAKIKKSDVDAEIEKTRQRQARYVDVADRECKD
ncbi:MAG: trigger factor family protein, partial [Clostridia bacterium]